MKKVTALLLAIVAVAALAIGMVGCAGGGSASSAAPEPTPSNAVKGMFDAIKAQDAEGLAKYYAGEAPESLDIKTLLAGDESFSSLPADQQAIVISMVDKVMEFDYAVDNEKVDGDKATVDVTFTTYDFGGLVQTLMTDLVSQAMSMSASGETDQDAVTAAMLESVKTALDGLTEKNTSATVTLDVSKDSEGNWKVDEVTDQAKANEIGDALLGGLMTKAEEIMGAFGGLDLDSLSSITDGAQSDKAA